MSTSISAPITDALLQQVIHWRRDFHQHPELSNREFRTAGKVAEHLRALGLTPNTQIAYTGVTAILKGAHPGPRIAIRGDMDALPVTERTGLAFASTVTAEHQGETVGVMHACGHDAHTAILMGVAEVLVAMKDKLAGEVMFVFQPAEEGPPEEEGGGAPMMLAEGIFNDFTPEAMFGLHVIANLPLGKVAVRPGPLLAGADLFTLKVLGRQTHAAQPWNGIDPIVAAAHLITGAQSIISRRTNITQQPAVLTFAAIHGGERHNIIPGEVELIGTLRSFDRQMRDAILADLRLMCEHIAAAHGAQVDTRQLPHTRSIPVTYNNPELTARILPSLRTAIGAGNVFEPPLILGSEDFAFFSHAVPSVFFLVGGTAPDQLGKAADHHAPDFFIEEGALETGLRAMVQVALDYLSPPHR